MTTIKGPLHFKKGFNVKEFMEKQDIKIKMPFEATGFSSSKIPESIDMTGIVLATDKSEKKEVKTVEKVVEEITLDSLEKIKGIGPKTVDDIKKSFKTIEELKQALRTDKVSLRDDVVEKLKKELL